MVREAAAVQAGDVLELEFRDGRVEAEARSARADSGIKGGQATEAAARDPQLRRTRRRRGNDQGSLF